MAKGFVTRALKSVAGNFGGLLHSANTADPNSDHSQTTLLVDTNHVDAIGEAQAVPSSLFTFLGRLYGIGLAIGAVNEAIPANSNGSAGTNGWLRLLARQGEDTNPAPVYSPIQFVDVTMTEDTSGAYASGEVIADSQILAGICRANDALSVLQSITMVDEDDQGVAMTLVFMSANVALGAENAAPSISDANSRTILGTIVIAAADWVDLGGTRTCTKPGAGIGLKPVTGTPDIYVGIINGTGTPTFTANGLKLRATALS